MRFAPRTTGVLGRLIALALGLILGGGVAFAQGVQTASLTGNVTSSDGQRMPGVTVSMTSRALQGGRSAVTDANGSYIFRGLPPGTYKTVFSLTGFATIERSVILEIGQSPDIDATMTVATVEESITVTGVAPRSSPRPRRAPTWNQDFIDKLPMGVRWRPWPSWPRASPTTRPRRTGDDLRASLRQRIPAQRRRHQATTCSARPTAFIEDAIEETQVLTSASPPSMRFGGVVNAVTKRGGNTFSGSFRHGLTNSA